MGYFFFGIFYPRFGNYLLIEFDLIVDQLRTRRLELIRRINRIIEIQSMKFNWSLPQGGKVIFYLEYSFVRIVSRNLKIL